MLRKKAEERKAEEEERKAEKKLPRELRRKKRLESRRKPWTRPRDSRERLRRGPLWWRGKQQGRLLKSSERPR